MPNFQFLLPSRQTRFLSTLLLLICLIASSPTYGLQDTATQPTDKEERLAKIRAEIEASYKKVFKVKVSAGELDRVNEFVSTPIWFEGIRPCSIEMVDEQKGTTIYGEIKAPGYREVLTLTKNLKDPSEAKNIKVPGKLVFVLPKLDAGQSMTYTCRRVKGNVPPRPYKWDDDGTKVATLNYDGKPIFRSMYEKVDNSSQERRDATYKVFHHVFSPDGSRLLTKGPGGKFPHHRGIFFGYNRISYDFLEPKKADIWHLKKGESQIAEAMIHQNGVASGLCRAAISWKGQDDVPFAIEQRDMQFFKVGDATGVDISITLSPVVADVKLEGDPQHAGVQFRASQLVPDHTAAMTYYLRPDDKAKPGEFRNWSNKENETEINKSHINLPWHAVCFALPELDKDGEVIADSKNVERYTVCYLNANSNPKPSRFSERDYGRFGSYIPATVKQNDPMFLNYRYWFFNGEKTVEEVAALSKRFENPVAVELVEN